jgi:TorA maturation chaperone TorD
MKEYLSKDEIRRDSYKQLSECYYLPDEKLIAQIKSPDMTLGPIFSHIVSNTPDIDDLDKFKLDYTQLFIGPFGSIAPPYESVYFEKRKIVMTDSTMEVKNLYVENGLNINIKEAPDHIAIELEFMYYLIFKQMEALHDSDVGSAAAYLIKQEDFLRNHLGRWVTEFANIVVDNAQTYFYKDLANITDSFVTKDLEYLESRVVQSPSGQPK